MYTTTFLVILVIYSFNQMVVQCRPQNLDTSATHQLTNTTPIPIISSTGYFGPDGSFNYSFETGNGINVSQSGVAKLIASNDAGSPNGEEIIIVSGSYSYTAPEGVLINITYIADENGYQPKGDSIPTQPPSGNLGSYQHLSNTTTTTTSIPIYPNPTA